MNLLYLVHRLPYPPNKGDKVRSYHLLKHLAARHRIFLGTFVDDPDDVQHVEFVQQLCAQTCIESINPRLQTLKSAAAFIFNEPLGLRFYKSAHLQKWVNKLLDTGQIDAVVVFSSVMAQFLLLRDLQGLPPLLVDFVDVDSDKWSQYAKERTWPLSWVYAREGVLLLKYEKKLSELAQASFFATSNELALFRKLTGSNASNLMSIDNGVDTEFFQPDPMRSSPFGRDTSGAIKHLVFTGAMDYWPNVDAVKWFVSEVMPKLRTHHSNICFHIVGRKPGNDVLGLACPDVKVTGTVPDVRPYLQFADVVVAPLRVARGVQNKILEAMAMGRPVVSARSCVDVIHANPGKDILAANQIEDYVDSILQLLNQPFDAAQMGRAARATVVQHYSWPTNLSKFDAHLLSEPN